MDEAEMKENEMNPKSKIHVLIVDDSLTVRKKVIEILKKAADITISGEARDGRDAIEQAKRLKPDVILMDIVMPVMSGLAAIEYIMTYQPIPIVIHSSAENRGETYKTWDAMMSGALAKIEKTDADKNPEKWEKDLIRTVRAASRVKISRRRKYALRKKKEKRTDIQQQVVSGDYNIVTFGASTGGPGVIANILKAFPLDFRLPILLVIHIPDSPIHTFPDWLNEHCGLNVAFASNGESLNGKKGKVFVGPPGKHMIVEHNRIRLLDSPPVNFCKPSIDVLFHSLAQDKHISPIAALLTGMMEDGALGLKAIGEAGGYTICQNKDTSIVFGMARAAIEIEAAGVVLPDYQIAREILSLARIGQKGRDR